MNKKEVIDYWVLSSRRDIKSAEILFKHKKYHHSLFFCHLFLEKLIKAVFVKKRNEPPPLIHDLVRLSEKAGLVLNDRLKGDMAEISTFNIQTRYDDYKLSFYKKAKRNFAEEFLVKSKEIGKWLKKYI